MVLYSFYFAIKTPSLMKGGLNMTRRQIDASRERRLWFTQVVMPTITVIVKAKASEAKCKIEDRIKKRKEGGA